MLMKNTKMYERLTEWFRQCGAYVPESVALGPLIQETYTIEEAELLTGMPLTLFEIGDLASVRGTDHLELSAKLDEMASRGLVYRIHVKRKNKISSKSTAICILAQLLLARTRR